jgi:hypothetical protein
MFGGYAKAVTRASHSGNWIAMGATMGTAALPSVNQPMSYKGGPLGTNLCYLFFFFLTPIWSLLQLSMVENILLVYVICIFVHFV